MSAKVDPLAGPSPDCGLCPRLVAFRAENRREEPSWFNGAVPAFGPADAKLLVVGLAPGLQGANRTGRPFTGDYAGDLLYPSLIKFGFAKGTYKATPGDITLNGCRITNAVRCVPPQNKPTPEEQRTCRSFLIAEIAALSKVRVILALGRIAHDAVCGTLGIKKFAGASYFPEKMNAIFASYAYNLKEMADVPDVAKQLNAITASADAAAASSRFGAWMKKNCA